MNSKPTASERRLRRTLIERAAAAGSTLLAAELSAYAKAEGINWEQLEREIGCDTDALNRIACCRSPRSQEFAADVGNIALYAGVDPERLLVLLRKLDVIREFVDGDRGEPGVRCVYPDMLLAARDRESDSDASHEAEAEDA